MLIYIWEKTKVELIGYIKFFLNAFARCRRRKNEKNSIRKGSTE